MADPDWHDKIQSELAASPLEGFDRLRLIYQLHEKYGPPRPQFDQLERRLLYGRPIVEVGDDG